jgi:hypothetical protein
MSISCKNELCLYQKAGACRLSRTGLDSSGFCDQCVLVSFPPAWLDTYKQNQLNHLESMEKGEP